MTRRPGSSQDRTEEQTLDDPRPPAADGKAPLPTGPGAQPPDARGPSDRDLIVRIQGGDLDAFELFFARHRSLIHRTAYGLTGDSQVAEEVLQDTFIRAYRHRHSLRTDVSPVPWLHRVALNLCYSRLGRRRLSTEPIGDATQDVRDATPGPQEHAEREELRRSIRLGVSSLPPKHQSVIVLYYLHGMSLQETSDALGVALGTVKSRLHYALHALRHHLVEERQGTAGPAPAGRQPVPLTIRRGDRG